VVVVVAVVVVVVVVVGIDLVVGVVVVAALAIEPWRTVADDTDIADVADVADASESTVVPPTSTADDAGSSLLHAGAASTPTTSTPHARCTGRKVSARRVIRLRRTLRRPTVPNGCTHNRARRTS
jgi:hypothetical protein